MLHQEICPDCGDLIPLERMDDDITICDCGYTRSSSQKIFDTRLRKTSSYAIIMLALFIMGTFIHTAQWGKDSIRVTPLQISEMVDGLSYEQKLEFAQINMDHKYYNRAEALFKSALEEDPSNLDVTEKLGMLLFQQRKFAEAAEVLEIYFVEGGENLQTLFSYGKSLIESQELGNAEQVFISLINSKPEVYQTSVVQALIDLYVAQEKFIEAKSFLATLVKPGFVPPAHLMEQRSLINNLMKKRT